MKKKHWFLYELKTNKMLFIMLIPTIVFFAINNYFPMMGVYYAFTNFSFEGGLFGSPFIGLSNFEFLFKSGTLLKITRNTLLYNLVFIVSANVLQVTIAILLSQMIGKWYRKICQSIMFLPYFVSYVILSVLVYNLFNFEHGAANTFLTSIGQQPVDFYNTPGIWKYLIVMFYLWKWVGYGTVVYLATILGISKDYYEAAEIDGANIFQQIRSITLPLLKPTVIILFLFSLGGILKGQFELFYQMVGNNGVLFETTDIIDTYVYRSLVSTFDIGMGTAAGLYQSVFGFILIITVNTIIKRKNPEYSLF